LRWTQNEAKPHGERFRRRLSVTAYCSRAHGRGTEYSELLRSFDRIDVVCEAYVDPTLGPHPLSGRERLQFFGGDDASQAQVTLETWLARKRKRGYAPRSEPSPGPSQVRLQLNSSSYNPGLPTRAMGSRQPCRVGHWSIQGLAKAYHVFATLIPTSMVVIDRGWIVVP
jgi:hypothetical protein